jgi:4-hydroxybenzoate polyprenyltransferase
MRPYLMFVSGIAGLAGVALVPEVNGASAVWIATAFFLSYGFGQALTDCFQLDTDALSAPYRPLVQGHIRRRDTLLVSLVGLVFTGSVLIVYNPWNAPLAALAVVGLATYTPFKRRWWAGPFYNAAIVALLPVMGWLAAGGWPAGRGVSTALLGTLAVTFFAYANFVLVGYFKDVSADGATGYRTLPVVFGKGTSSLVSDVFALLAVAGAWLVFVVSDVEWPVLESSTWSSGHTAALVLLVLGTVATMVAQRRTHRVRFDAEAYRAIEPVLHAHVLLLAAIATRFQPGWAPLLVAFCVAFPLALRARPEQAQI